MSRPGHNHGNPDSSLIQIALIATPDTVAVEKIGIGSSFLMRAIVTCKNNKSILVHSFFFQFLDQLSYIYIESINHRSECSTWIQLSAISSFTESRTSRFKPFVWNLRKFTAKFFNNAIFGNNQFSMRNNGRIK